LKTAYATSKAEKEELKVEIEQWEKDYKDLEDKSLLDIGWNVFEHLLRDFN